MDGDNSVEGEIIEITLFQIEIKDKEGDIYHYPNNLFMQKPIKKFKDKNYP
jgi:small-conductance mechanosensitive channel